jgi:hypothetical protein
MKSSKRTENTLHRTRPHRTRSTLEEKPGDRHPGIFMKFIMTYLRTFTHEFECATLQEADVRSKVWAKNFPPGDVTVLSVIQEGYRSPPEAAELVLICLRMPSTMDPA